MRHKKPRALSSSLPTSRRRIPHLLWPLSAAGPSPSPRPGGSTNPLPSPALANFPLLRHNVCLVDSRNLYCKKKSPVQTPSCSRPDVMQTVGGPGRKERGGRREAGGGRDVSGPQQKQGMIHFAAKDDDDAAAARPQSAFSASRFALAISAFRLMSLLAR